MDVVVAVVLDLVQLFSRIVNAKYVINETKKLSIFSSIEHSRLNREKVSMVNYTMKFFSSKMYYKKLLNAAKTSLSNRFKYVPDRNDLIILNCV